MDEAVGEQPDGAVVGQQPSDGAAEQYPVPPPLSQYPPPAHPPAPPNPPQAVPPAYGYYPPPAAAKTGTNGLAIASLVLGIVWIYWIGSILALIFGYVAKSQIDRTGRAQGGRGMAIAGIVLGWVGLGVLLLTLVLGFTFSLSS